MSLDIVIPAHNEERRIDRTLLAYRAAFPQADVGLRVALDGCRDATATVVADHAAADARVAALEFPKLGKGGVLMEAFRRCDADWVAFVDADCATPPAELARLVEDAGAADGAIASRRHPASFTPCRRPGARRLTSTGFAWGVQRLFHLPYADTQCGAKVLRRDVVAAVVPLLSSRDFLFDVDLLVTARQLGFHLLEVPTIWLDQADSNVRAGRDAARMLSSALRLWLHHRVMPLPTATATAAAGDLTVAEPRVVDRVA